ncbi:Hypothetical_protein [Hexamita inflata]|uniref:Hypothetical_protein n=1 Tax=Hexamita inflata TaxID=28002 RepID=A0AA86QDC3_9EUKA|nr:Hypothetical protein HINF_LOCUS41787 [Hexamita inflata]
MGSRTPVFPLSNGLNPSFMPTQQRPNRALTESLADQFHLIRQLTFQKLVLASQFLFARYFLRLAREVVPLYWHCLVVVAFDASFHQLDQVPGFLLSLFVFANSQFRGILPVVDQLFPRVQARWYLPQLSIFRQTISDIPFGASSSRLSLRMAWFPILRQLSYFVHLDHLLAMI